MRWYTTILASLAVAVTVPVALLFGPAPAGVPLPAYPETAAWLAEPVHPPDPARATPAQVAAFFAAEPAAVTADLVRRYPRIVGNLDGAPVAARLAANASVARRTDALAYDPRGDGRIAVVVGDLAHADRVAVLVPGVDTTLANVDRGLGGVARRAPAWQARQLAAAMTADDPDAHAAVVAWLGYDPPEGIRRDALREERAATGAVALDRFVAGLAAQLPGLAVTVVGHSYGSTVAGLAAPGLDPCVHDLVALGSPGLGGAGTVRDLRTGARVWAGTAAGDWTRDIPGVRILGVGHGRLPTDPRFGARVLPVAGVRDHDGYFLPGSTSLAAIAWITLGRPELVGIVAAA